MNIINSSGQLSGHNFKPDLRQQNSLATITSYFRYNRQNYPEGLECQTATHLLGKFGPSHETVLFDSPFFIS